VQPTLSSPINLNLFSDGGARGNPGAAASSWLLFSYGGSLIDFGAEYLGTNTNNFAEYNGLISGLSQIVKLNGAVAKTRRLPENFRLICHLDSELVVKQLRGEYKVKEASLQKLALKAHSLIAEITTKGNTVEFVHVERKLNHLADKLVNIALDAHLL